MEEELIWERGEVGGGAERSGGRGNCSLDVTYERRINVMKELKPGLGYEFEASLIYKLDPVQSAKKIPNLQPSWFSLER